MEQDPHWSFVDRPKKVQDPAQRQDGLRIIDGQESAFGGCGVWRGDPLEGDGDRRRAGQVCDDLEGGRVVGGVKGKMGEFIVRAPARVWRTRTLHHMLLEERWKTQNAQLLVAR